MKAGKNLKENSHGQHESRRERGVRPDGKNERGGEGQWPNAGNEEAHDHQQKYHVTEGCGESLGRQRNKKTKKRKGNLWI